jgi:hypothetical protein
LKCLKLYENQGRFQQAGKIMKSMGEEYESNMEYKEAIGYYRKGADYFSMETSNSKSYEQGCLLKLADLLCLTDDPTAEKESKAVKKNKKLLNFFLLKNYLILDLRENCFPIFNSFFIENEC